MSHQPPQLIRPATVRPLLHIGAIVGTGTGDIQGLATMLGGDAKSVNHLVLGAIADYRRSLYFVHQQAESG